MPAAIVSLVCLAAVACGSDEPAQPPVATPSFSVSSRRAPLGSPVEVTYKFTVAPDAPRFDQRYHVLVHFLDAEQELMWTDDHQPPTPTTEWKPGQTIEYTRTMFIPIYPYIGEATVEMGLYSPKDSKRLPLAGEDSGQRAYKVGTIELLPQSENVFLIFGEGWNQTETSSENPAVEWQWTRRSAVITFRNPRRDAWFYLHADGRPDLIGKPQEVTVSLNGQAIDTFSLTDRSEVIRKVPVTAAQFGDSDTVTMQIEVGETFVPSLIPALNSNDARELGIRVFHAFVEPK